MLLYVLLYLLCIFYHFNLLFPRIQIVSTKIQVNKMARDDGNNIYEKNETFQITIE